MSTVGLIYPTSVSLDLQVRKVSQLDNLLTAVFSMAKVSGTGQTEVNALIPVMLYREFGSPTWLHEGRTYGREIALPPLRIPQTPKRIALQLDA